MERSSFVVKKASEVNDKFFKELSIKTCSLLKQKYSSAEEIILLGRKLSLEPQKVDWKQDLVVALRHYKLIRNDTLGLNISRCITKFYAEIFLWRTPQYDDGTVEKYLPEYSNERYETYVCFTERQANSLIDFLNRTLDLRKSQILQYRFGLKNGKILTLKEVGKIFDLSANRIRQIEATSLRELREQKRRMPRLFESEADIQKADELVRHIRDIRQSLVFLEEFRMVNELRNLSFSPFSTVNADISRYTYGTALDSVPIEDLGFTSKTCRDLRSSRIVNLRGILKEYHVEPDPKDGHREHETNEVRIKLKKLLYDDSFNYSQPVCVINMGFSTRTFNCLSRAGLVTVDDIIDNEDRLFKVRNLGVKGINEISEKVHSLGYTDFNPRLS